MPGASRSPHRWLPPLRIDSARWKTDPAGAVFWNPGVGPAGMSLSLHQLWGAREGPLGGVCGTRSPSGSQPAIQSSSHPEAAEMPAPSSSSPPSPGSVQCSRAAGLAGRASSPSHHSSGSSSGSSSCRWRLSGSASRVSVCSAGASSVSVRSAGKAAAASGAGGAVWHVSACIIVSGLAERSSLERSSLMSPMQMAGRGTSLTVGAWGMGLTWTLPLTVMYITPSEGRSCSEPSLARILRRRGRESLEPGGLPRRFLLSDLSCCLSAGGSLACACSSA
mmetsp:Transcript_19615/g.48140  ORF Transcript_19615/g.48140 Transcript_19615/m.48140 type:complete len:278 (-) Transcript_19615:49-882(-)